MYGKVEDLLRELAGVDFRASDFGRRIRAYQMRPNMENKLSAIQVLCRLSTNAAHIS
jgi:hypothetical protein